MQDRFWAGDSVTHFLDIVSPDAKAGRPEPLFLVKIGLTWQESGRLAPFHHRPAVQQKGLVPGLLRDAPSLTDYENQTTMKKHRGKLVLLLLTSMAMVASVVGKQILYPTLPPPREANQKQLLRWMFRDLSLESLEIQSALVDRIEEEVMAGFSLSPTQEMPGPRTRKHLWSNIELLERRWFDDRVAQYAVCSNEERIALLDREIEVVRRYRELGSDMIRKLPPEERAVFKSRPHFQQQIDSWIDAREGDSRRIALEAYEATVTRWLATGDLSDFSLDARKKLAERIALRLNDGAVAKQSFASLPEGEQTELRANGLMLMEAWLHSRAAEYKALTEDLQSDFVDEQIDHVVQWNLIEVLGDSEAQNNPLKAFLWLEQTTQAWIERSDPESRQAFETLVSEIKNRLVHRYLHPETVE